MLDNFLINRSVVNYSRSMTPTRCTNGARDRTGPMDPGRYVEVPMITNSGGAYVHFVGSSGNFTYILIFLLKKLLRYINE